MKCPFCGHENDRVLETRVHNEGEQIRRRRECLECNDRYSTVESIVVNLPLVIKKDGRREEYSKDKLGRGIQAACQKRPVSLAQMDSIVERVTNWVLTRSIEEISAQIIGQKVMGELKKLDNVAYVRFASVYRTFHDVEEFVDGLKDDLEDSSKIINEEPRNTLPS
jgi:transcriptional repressor NrdR